MKLRRYSIVYRSTLHAGSSHISVYVNKLKLIVIVYKINAAIIQCIHTNIEQVNYVALPEVNCWNTLHATVPQQKRTPVMLALIQNSA
jgi:hypothetical protein